MSHHNIVNCHPHPMNCHPHPATTDICSTPEFNNHIHDILHKPIFGPHQHHIPTTDGHGHPIVIDIPCSTPHPDGFHLAMTPNPNVHWHFD